MKRRGVGRAIAHYERHLRGYDVNKSALIIVGLVLGTAGAWAADTVAGPPHGSPFAPGGGTDGTLELKWDTGSINEVVAWYTGAGAWAGVDFDVSTLTSYNYVSSCRIYYYPNWPNGIFEGNRAGAWSFPGGTPGSLLWGPTYVRGTAFGWNTFAAGYDLGATTAFVIAFEQYYNYPICDPVVNLASSGTYSHSWYYYGGAWHPIGGLGYGSFPLMTRCIVDDEHHNDVTPASLGRVKAMYH